jgi:hypothetical protein
VSVVHSIHLIALGDPDLFIHAPTLACQSLKTLKLTWLEMDEDHIRVLGDFSRPDLEIALLQFKITSAGASALAEVFGRNQGPTKLVSCQIDNVVLV